MKFDIKILEQYREEGKHIPTQDFEIFEKLDGQYIGAFMYNGELIVNSRGSFASVYAQKAKEILETKYPKFIDFIKTEYYSTTYCFELIGYEQIVVSYPEEDLVLTGIFFNDTNAEYHPCCYNWQPDYFEISIAKRYSGLDYTKIKELNWKNSEGFVVRFSNGSRCKVKFDDYCTLHRQMTNLSTTGIWEALSQGIPLSSILENVPDEFFEKVHQYEEELKVRFNSEVEVYQQYYDIITGAFPNASRKELAELFLKLKHANPKILFSMLDGKDYSQIIWKIIKPKFEKI